MNKLLAEKHAEKIISQARVVLEEIENEEAGARSHVEILERMVRELKEYVS